jgi:dTDP-4-amino-4,6-dideoxygalactose transaminase
MMEYLDELLAKRAELAAAYTERLKDHPAVTLPHVTEHGRHSWQSFPILIDHRNEVLEKMRAAGIETQIGTHALHCYPAFQNDDRVRLTGDLANSRYAFEHCLVLPMYFEMTMDVLDHVVNELSRCLSEVGAGALQRA